jgi:hypothetical protein
MPNHRSLLEGQADRFASQLFGAGHGVLSERAAGDAVHLVADLGSGHLSTDRGHSAGEVPARYPVLRSGEAQARDPHQVWLAGHQVPGAAVESGRMHPHQDVVVSNLRHGDVLVAQHARVAVPVLDNGAHGGRLSPWALCAHRDVLWTTYPPLATGQMTGRNSP